MFEHKKCQLNYKNIDDDDDDDDDAADDDDDDGHTVKPAFNSDHLSTNTTLFVSLENDFSLKHVLKEPVCKDHFFVFPLGDRDRQVWL